MDLTICQESPGTMSSETALSISFLSPREKSSTFNDVTATATLVHMRKYPCIKTFVLQNDYRSVFTACFNSK
jgi:hypothetical protein